MSEGSLCQLGATAANPVLTTLRYFRDEYVAHIEDKQCPAGACKELIQYEIDKEKCTGCVLCLKSCPTNAIIGEAKKVHIIILYIFQLNNNYVSCLYYFHTFICIFSCNLFKKIF